VPNAVDANQGTGDVGNPKRLVEIEGDQAELIRDVKDNLWDATTSLTDQGIPQSDPAGSD